MEVTNKSTYQSSIYSAIVVNDNVNDDPDYKYRVQIYIPSMYPEYLDIYEDYINSSDKSNNGNKDKFPWAQTLVKDLKNGNIVYGSFIYGKSNQFIILGLDATNPKNESSSSSSSIYNISGSGLLDLAMGIIMHNEVGLAIGQYPDGLTDANYGNINPADNGGCSIGLIQWHESNAIDLLRDIKNANSNWESYWTDKSLTTFTSLKSGTIKYSNFGETWKLTKGSAEYNAIYKMLISEEGKRVQREKASQRTAESMEKLQSEFNVTNPALLIYCADIMNQYGNYVNSSSDFPNLKGCMTYAGECCKDGSDMISQLDKFIVWWKDKTKNYYSRRDTTYTYIKNCYDQGKLTTGGLTDQGEQGNAIAGNGQYCIPFVGSHSVSAGYGRYPKGTQHSGIDFSMPNGTKLVACTNATVAAAGPSGSGYGIYVKLTGDDGNTIIYGHMQRVYVSKGQKVTKGQIIGEADHTGNSTGPHLHFEIRPKGGGSGQYGSTNPWPYLGYSFGTGEGVGTNIQGG